MMQMRFTEYYESISIVYEGESNDPEPSDTDDSRDTDYVPHGQRKGRDRRSSMSEGMLQTIENVLLSMLVKGTTPQGMAASQRRKNCVSRKLAEQKSSNGSKLFVLFLTPGASSRTEI